MEKHAALWRKWGIEETPKWWSRLLADASELDRHPGTLPYRRIQLVRALTAFQKAIHKRLEINPTGLHFESAPTPQPRTRRQKIAA